MVVLQVLTPYTLDKLLLSLEKHLRQNPSLNLSPATRGRLLDILPVIRHSITILHRCHLAVFYLQAVYYHISKRLSGIQYVSMIP